MAYFVALGCGSIGLRVEGWSGASVAALAQKLFRWRLERQVIETSATVPKVPHGGILLLLGTSKIICNYLNDLLNDLTFQKPLAALVLARQRWPKCGSVPSDSFLLITTHFTGYVFTWSCKQRNAFMNHCARAPTRLENICRESTGKLSCAQVLQDKLRLQHPMWRVLSAHNCWPICLKLAVLGYFLKKGVFTFCI